MANLNNSMNGSGFFDAESTASSPMLVTSSSRNVFNDDDLISDEDAAYQRQIREQEEREAQRNAAAQNRGPTLLNRYAKRAIVKRIEHARQEQVAARASELLVQEQNRRRKMHRSHSSLHATSSFFCRSTSYPDLRYQESGAFGPSASVAEYDASGVFGPSAAGGGATASDGGPSVDVTFGALVDELKEAMPKSGLPTPDIALVMDRFLSPGVPVHFIGSLQRLRQTLRDISRLSRSIRRHMDMHSDMMQELEEVIDEDAEEEENARKKIDREIKKDSKANKMRRERRRRGTNAPTSPQARASGKPSRRRGLVPDGEGRDDEDDADVNVDARRKQRDGSSSGSSRARQESNAFHADDDESATFHLVPPSRGANGSAAGQDDQKEEHDDQDSDLDSNKEFGEKQQSLNVVGDEDEDEEDEEAKPHWVGCVPRVRTLRPRTALLERMSQLVQKADMHAARVIDDVVKWRRYSHVPMPFFHEGDNVFFLLHRRYGAGLAFNRACDLLRRYAAGEVFFYVSPFDFSVSSDDAAVDSAAGSMRVAGSRNDDGDDDRLMDGLMSESSSPTGSPLGEALGELKTVASFSTSEVHQPPSEPTGAAAAAAAHSSAAVGKGGGSGPPDMREKWKRIEREAEAQNRYLKRTLTQLAGGWYRPSLKVITDLLWERHLYAKQQAEGKAGGREQSGGSYMRFSSSSSINGGKAEGLLDSGGGGGSSLSASTSAGKRLYKTLNDSRGGTSGGGGNGSSSISSNHSVSTLPSSQNPFNPGVRMRNNRKMMIAERHQQQRNSEPPRTSIASATDQAAESLRLGLDWRFLSAGCFIPIISKDLRTHLIMCCRNGMSHVAKHNPGVGATAGTAVQRLIALNASHLARRYLHLWQAALRRRKRLRLQAAQLAVRNIERQRKLRFGTFMKFYNFRNESGRLWRPMLQKVRASLIRRYMHHLFMNRAFNITARAMRRALYMRYYRMLHFLVVRRRVNGARVTFSQEGDRRKIRGSTAASTKDALRELAAAAALVNPMQGIKLQMERHYASDGDALRVVAETGGGAHCAPSLVQVIAAGRRMLPFRRFHDEHDVERARIVTDEFVAKRELIFEWCVLNLMSFAQSQRVSIN